MRASIIEVGEGVACRLGHIHYEGTRSHRHEYVDGNLEKVCFGRSSDSWPNPPYLRDEKSNGTLGFQKFQIKVYKRSYVSSRKSWSFLAEG